MTDQGSAAETLNMLKPPWDAQGIRRQATVSQVHIWLSDETRQNRRGSWRTGAFCLTPITMGYTACSVKGVLVVV